MNPLPPQAYTKETLLKAYAWLMNQNGSIREMATTPDILVSLYLKATRDGDGALDRPSIQNFKNELKNLAGLMGELDRPQTQAAPSAQTQTPPQQQFQQQQPSQTHSTHQFTAAPTATSTPPASAHIPPIGFPSAASMPSFQVAGEVNLQLDTQSLLMIQEVKEDLNLSSEAEALRMLIKVGYSRSKNLLK